MGHSDKPLFVIGSALIALLLIVGFNTYMDIKDKHHKGQPEAGYTLETADTATASTKVEASASAAPEAGAGASGDIAALVASGDVAKGKKRFARCVSCHSVKKDAPSKTGPNLYGLVGRDIASVPDYADKYSAAMKAKGGKWTLEELAAFIANPKKALPGTKMIFPGLKKEKQQANLLAYIKTLSD